MSATTAGRRPGRFGRAVKWIFIVVVVVAAVLALAAWVATIVLRPHLPSPATLTRRMQVQAALTGGAQVYATHCAYCHSTKVGPDLARLAPSPALVYIFVRHGPAAMPSFTPAQVSDADIDAVAAYIATMPPRKLPS